MLTDSSIYYAMDAGRTFVSLMSSSDEGCVTTFNHDVIVRQELTDDKDKLINAISFNAFGNTAMWDGVFEGLLQLGAARNPCRVLIVMTDGYSNQDVNHDINDVLNLARAMGIQVYTIGLGLSIDDFALRILAEWTGGKFYWSPSNVDLVAIYNEIINRIRIISDCTIEYEIDCPDGTLRTVDLQLLCGITQTRTYRAAYDSTVFKPVTISIKDTSILGGSSYTFPIEFSDSIKSARIRIFSCGQLVSTMPSTKIPGGIEITGSGKSFGEITLTVPDTDTLCQIKVEWSAVGCIQPIPTSAWVFITKRRPRVFCDIIMRGDTAIFTLENRGNGVALNTKIWNGNLFSVGDIDSVRIFSWVVTGNDSVKVCATAYFDNHIDITCCTWVWFSPKLPKIKCNLTIIDSTVFLVLMNSGNAKAKGVFLQSGQMTPLWDFDSILVYQWDIHGMDSVEVCARIFFSNHPTIQCCQKTWFKVPISCNITAPDTVDGPFTLKAWGENIETISVLKSSKTTGYVSFAKNDSAEFNIIPVSYGYDTLRILFQGHSQSLICEKIIYIIPHIRSLNLLCQANSVVFVDSGFNVTLTVKNNGTEIFNGKIVFIGSKRFVGEKEKWVSIRPGETVQWIWSGLPILPGKDTLVFKVGDETCIIVVDVLFMKPLFTIQCRLTETQLIVTVRNTGSPDSLDLFVETNIMVKQPPFRKIYVVDSIEAVWDVVFSQGLNTVRVNGCFAERIIPKIGPKDLRCGGPDTVYPGEISLYSIIDSEQVLLLSRIGSYEQFVVDSTTWKVKIDSTTTFTFISNGLICQKTVYVIYQKEGLSCDILTDSLSSELQIRITNIGNTIIQDKPILIYPDSVLIETSPEEFVLKPGESVILVWKINILESTIDRFYRFLMITRYTSCSKNFFRYGVSRFVTISLPEIAAQYGEYIQIPVVTDVQKPFTVDIVFSPKVVSFLSATTQYGIRDSVISLNGSSVLNFQAINKEFSISQLTPKNLKMTGYTPIYQPGKIWVSGDCIVPLVEGTIIFDVLGRKVDHLGRGTFIIWENGKVSKVRVY